MCTSTVALADAPPAQPGVGDGLGEGDGVGLGDGVGEAVAVGVGVAVGLTVNDRVSADEPFPARSIARVEKVYEPAPSPLYVFGDEQLE